MAYKIYYPNQLNIFKNFKFKVDDRVDRVIYFQTYTIIGIGKLEKIDNKLNIVREPVNLDMELLTNSIEITYKSYKSPVYDKDFLYNKVRNNSFYEYYVIYSDI